MYETTYHRPATVATAAANPASPRRRTPSDLAGGQTLLPTMKQRLAVRPAHLVDLSSCIAETEGHHRERQRHGRRSAR
jgi:CO/xanthine dehydrogenase FAD-binding subunit